MKYRVASLLKKGLFFRSVGQHCDKDSIEGCTTADGLQAETLHNFNQLHSDKYKHSDTPTNTNDSLDVKEEDIVINSDIRVDSDNLETNEAYINNVVNNEISDNAIRNI